MLDIRLIRKEPERVKEQLSRRDPGLTDQINLILKGDQHGRETQTELDGLKAKRNRLSKSVSSPEEAERIRAEVQEINVELAKIEVSLEQKKELLELDLLHLPNLPAADVPTGRGESDNKLVHTWGSIPSIAQPQEHWQLAERLGIWDQERTAKISGTRFSSFLGQGARLQRALINFFLDEAIEDGYQEFSPPAIVRTEALKGTGQLPKFVDDIYALSEDGPYLIPTAEVPLTAFWAATGKILAAAELPKRLCAYTPCFRKEAGSAGKDTRGLIRQHQFDKVELVHICRPEESPKEHELLTEHAEKLLQKLELPYRRMLLCTGDMGFAAAKCYDLEVWFPGQGTYREVSSCSNCTDFQARRLNLKYQPPGKEPKQLVHTLNGSGLAVGRIWAALLENYQNPDGSITIPPVLRKYFPEGQEKIS